MSESKYISLLSDLGFKKVFGKENSSEEFLIDFLNELFKDDPDLSNIVSVRYKNNEKSPNHSEDKEVFYDLFCETDTGHRFIVEMQKQTHKYFADRVTYYMCREISEQLADYKNRNNNDYRLLPVVGVFITNFTVSGMENKPVVHGKFLDPESGKVVLDKLKCAFVQLSQFNKTPEECITGFDKWMYILKNMENLQEIPFKTYKNQLFQRLGELSKVTNLSGEERRQYERDLRWVRDYNAVMQYAIEEGQEKGRAEGRAEGQQLKAKEIAGNMKKSGMRIEDIAALTGLPLSDIELL